MRLRIALVLASLVVVFVGVLPAWATPPAAELLLHEPPAGFQPVPEQANIDGWTDVQQLGALDGLDVPVAARSIDGYRRAWTRKESALVGYALTFDGDRAAAGVLETLVASLQAGDNATTLPGVGGGAVATIRESAAYTTLETAVFARGSVVFAFVGSGGTRNDVIAAVAQQNAAVALPAAPAASSLDGPPVELVLAAAVALALIGLFVGRGRIRQTRGQPAAVGAWSLTPPP